MSQSRFAASRSIAAVGHEYLHRPRYRKSTCNHAHQAFRDTTYMPIKARPFGCQEQFDWGADIQLVCYDDRLSIRVLRNRNKDDGIEVTFPQVDGFRLLVVQAHWRSTRLLRTFLQVIQSLRCSMAAGRKKKTSASAMPSSNASGLL